MNTIFWLSLTVGFAVGCMIGYPLSIYLGFKDIRAKFIETLEERKKELYK